MFNLAESFWEWKYANKDFMKYRLQAYAGLAGILRNQGKDNSAGKVFIKGYQSGVKKVDVGPYRMNIEFNNNTEFNIWIENKMYAYGSGTYKNQGGKLQGIQGLLPKWVNLVALKIEREGNVK